MSSIQFADVVVMLLSTMPTKLKTFFNSDYGFSKIEGGNIDGKMFDSDVNQFTVTKAVTSTDLAALKMLYRLHATFPLTVRAQIEKLCQNKRLLL